MGSIFKRKDSKGRITYTARIRKKGIQEQVATFSNKTDATGWIQQQETKIRQGLHLDISEAKKHTLSETIERFIKEKSPNVNQIRHLQCWREKLGALFLAGIDGVAINNCITAWKSELNHKPATSNRYLATLGATMKVAKEWGWIRQNPVSEAKRQKEPRGIVRFLSDDERSALFEAAKDSFYPHLYLIIVIALSTGMRSGELLNLKWSDVDLTNGVIILQKTKNGDKRRVALKSHALELLRLHGKVRHIDSDLLFPGEINSSVPHDIRRSWLKAVNDAGLKAFRFHDLRHSCASYLAMNGATPFEIAEVLGHKTLEMVKRYAHLAESHTAKVVEKMNERIFG